MEYIPRPQLTRQLENALADSPITALLGPRQCGKTWLARPFATKRENLFDLHDFVDRTRLIDSRFGVLDTLEGTVVIDEVQEMPELFFKLRVLADRPFSNARFLITGSASPGIVRGVAESLAGRVRHIGMSGFTADEVGWEHWRSLWLKGGFPPSYLRQIEDNALQWRLDYIQTFLSRDLPALAETKMSSDQLRRLLQFLAHSHGQAWKSSEPAQVIGVNYKTVQRHLEILCGAYILRELPPYHVNLGKRLRKAPKVYLRDSGLLHALLMLREMSQVQSHPRYGASWEGFCIEQIIRLTNTREEECFSFTVQGGQECDLILAKPQGLFGFEFKAADAPTRTRSMVSSVSDLELTHLFVIYPGDRDYMLDEKIEVVGFSNLPKIIPRLL